MQKNCAGLILQNNYKQKKNIAHLSIHFMRETNKNIEKVILKIPYIILM